MAKSFEDRDGWIWMNGNFIPWKNATSHIVSQGLHYASAVFEGERAYNGKIFKSEEHTKRFFKSAEIIGIKIPYSEEELNSAKKNLSQKEFLEIKINWLIKKNRIRDLETLLKSNLELGQNSKVIKFLIDEYIASSDIKSACEKINFMDRTVKNTYLKKSPYTFLPLNCIIYDYRNFKSRGV